MGDLTYASSLLLRSRGRRKGKPMLLKIVMFDTPGDHEFIPSAHTSWEVEVVGGGGGGGGAPVTPPGKGSAGGGGGGGGYSAQWGAKSLPAKILLTVGEGGTPGVGSDPNEVSHRGGSSKFGNIASATGGRGGGGSPASATWDMRLGGSPGVGQRGYLNIPGQPGEHGFIGPGGKPSRGGQGGHSRLGSGGRTPGIGSDGRSPLGGYGGGGSGASNGPGSSIVRAGGKGAAGVIIVRLYG